MRFATLATALIASVSFAVASLEPSPAPVSLQVHELEKRGWAKVYTKCSQSKTVALTFDDGTICSTVADIRADKLVGPYKWHLVATLAKYKAKGTFFVNGNNWECAYDDSMIDAMRAGLDAGHEHASHTWTHKNLSTLTWDQIHSEMYKTELMLNRILGVQPAMMRPPFGEYNDLVRSASGTRNQSLILWDLDSKDALGAQPSESIQFYKDLLKKKPANILPLNHEIMEKTTTTVIPEALSLLSSAGYKMATVSECLGIKPYQWKKAYVKKDPKTWTCAK